MSDQGTVFPVTAMLFLVGIVMAGLMVELGSFAALWREAAFAADVGAEAGAGQVRAKTLYRDIVKVDVDRAPAIARQAARQARPRSGRTVSVEVTSKKVCVTVRQRSGPGVLALVGARSRTVAVESCARPKQG